MRQLVLITNSYPYGTYEQPFIEKELVFSLQLFDRVVIIPLHVTGEYALNLEEERIRVIADYAKHHRVNLVSKIYCAILALFSLSFYREILSRPVILVKLLSLKRLLLLIGEAKRFYWWLKKNVLPNSSLLYSYWLGSTTLALSYLADKIGVPVISRAHGIDLYVEVWRDNYQPLQKYIISRIAYVYTISQHGELYLKHKYPKYADRIRLARLGVEIPQQPPLLSRDARICTIVSCSYMRPVKRVPLIAESLVSLRSERKVVWHHFGEGIEIEACKSVIGSAKTNVTAIFHGNVDNREILKFYKECYVDLFISLSSSEGLPVSIMEAMAHGIPVLATDVGGCRELVNDKTGRLLTSYPSKEEVVTALEEFLGKSQSESAQYRINAYATAKAKVNADTNYKNFVEELLKIVPHG